MLASAGNAQGPWQVSAAPALVVYHDQEPEGWSGGPAFGGGLSVGYVADRDDSTRTHFVVEGGFMYRRALLRSGYTGHFGSTDIERVQDHLNVQLGGLLRFPVGASMRAWMEAGVALGFPIWAQTQECGPVTGPYGDVPVDTAFNALSNMGPDMRILAGFNHLLGSRGDHGLGVRLSYGVSDVITDRDGKQNSVDLELRYTRYIKSRSSKGRTEPRR
ncbi:MAG: hypothetical protein JNL05_13265 [Flavobacteriales bacterium]|nr:hypothetical protein [Flavobacteriales bacterium]